MALHLRPDPLTYRQLPTSAIHQLASIEPIQDFIFRLTYNEFIKMSVHENPLVSRLTEIQNINQFSSFARLLL